MSLRSGRPEKLLAAAAAAASAILAGCGPYVGGMGSFTRSSERPTAPVTPFNINVNDMMARQKLLSEMQSEPDLPAWHDQREKMALAIGDRVFDKSFDRTFDAMIIALANLGCRVNNMERVSGYITSSLPQLPPEQTDALRKEALAQYAQAKGYPSSVLQSSSSPFGDMMLGASMMEQMSGGVTLTMTRQDGARTKVKLRFNNVYYPRTVEELYKRVWDAVDKQIFLDKGLG